MERDRALLELERRWRGGEQWPQTSKLHGLLLNFIKFIDLLENAIDYPRRGHKKRKKRRRKRPQRGARSSGSVAHTDAGPSESSSHTPVGGSTSSAHLSPPTSQNGALGLSSDNLIDFNSPPPGQNINGLMETLNIN